MKGFFDTNVILYALGGDAAKLEVAKQHLRSGGVISVQVLNEFISVTRGKMKQAWPEVNAALALIRTLDLTVVPMTVDAQTVAASIAREHHIHIYDAMIIASAQEAGCDVLWSEDMQDGRLIGELTIRNPFKLEVS